MNRQFKEKKHDKAVGMTFPASDLWRSATTSTVLSLS